MRKLLLAILLAGAAHGESESRLAAIEEQQQAKAERVVAERQNSVERRLNWVTDNHVVERITGGLAGWQVKLGGMAPGSGFAAGPEFHTNTIWSGRAALRAGAQTSTRGWRKFDLELALPRISDRFFAQWNTVYHDYSGLSYYGPGPGSEKTGRTGFRLEDTATDLTFGVRPFRHLTLASSAGYLFNNVGRGTDSRYASTESVYTPVQAPGIREQANYVRTGAFVQFDWRDNPGGPRRGGNYFAQFHNYRDQTLGTGSFQRLDLEAQQYVSVLNQRRVFAVRARTALTFHDGKQSIPFYMQPALGGSEDLRGYRPFRFRGDNNLLLNAEYRWEVFSGLDMALFADGGKVFDRKADFHLRNLETDAGFGFRFNARNQTFLRLDFGFSHEGFQIWVKFANLFKKGPVHTSSSLGDM